MDRTYKETDEREKVPNYEQKKWEEERMATAAMKFGAKDAAERQKNKKEYDYILDDQIDFVQSLKMPGTKDQVSIIAFLT